MANRDKETNPQEELKHQTPGRQQQEDIRGQQRTPDMDKERREEAARTGNEPASKKQQSGK